MSSSQAQADGLPRAIPRVRLVRVALTIVVVIGLTAGARALWEDREHAEREYALTQLFARYTGAEAALARLIPADVTEVHTSGCGAGTCGFSKRDPPQLAAQLRELLPGSKLVYTGEEEGCPASGATCVAQVEGRFHGFEVAGIAFWHPLVLPYSQMPPHGAIESHSRFDVHRHRATRLFFLGSNVDLLLREPAALRGESE